MRLVLSIFFEMLQKRTRNSVGSTLAMLCSAAVITGCASSSRQLVNAPPSTMPSDVYPASRPTTIPADMPSASSKDFNALWKACEKSLVARNFRIDRRDFRAGILTTYPLISKQIFEPWRTDTLGASSVLESTLATIRRTVRVEFTHDEATDTYIATPFVTIERYTNAGRRITSTAMYRSAYRRTEARGSREADQGLSMPSRYWYSLGNDPALEAALVKSTASRLR